MPNQETTTLAFCIKQFVNPFKYPHVILTDLNQNFECGLINAMCVRLKLDNKTTSAHNPQCNKQTERFNRIINAMLTQYVKQIIQTGIFIFTHFV